jgi:N-acetyl-anhydromuramyl-L-alanine amidase AmpD
MSNFPITHIVLHYSATYADQDLDIRDIDKMHRARGFNGVGYHYVIKRDGMIERGRKETEVGAHVGGQNTGKIGICLIGGLERPSGPNVGVDNRTDAQKQSAASLIRDLLTRYPWAKVVGHRDLAATLCPAYDAAAWWASVNKPVVNAPKPASKSVSAVQIWTVIIAALTALMEWIKK